MTTAERIYAEVRHMPEELADQVLDFVLFLEGRHAHGQETDTKDEALNQPPNSLRQHMLEEQESDLKLDKKAVAELIANAFPLKDNAFPIKKEEIYDRRCLR